MPLPPVIEAKRPKEERSVSAASPSRYPHVAITISLIGISAVTASVALVIVVIRNAFAVAYARTAFA